ncbi:hypothetical protein D0B54_18885 [Solimonas sp. K1W22B-7]|uniref:glycosyltransferase 87 family protein n=1 Tax=Solimonas sp. K1W22B-7 TaxID=2303331 RepID=UPI000E3376A9|nr:glycosyltransferase 87 family protein [Solimonas sp. K1W22B-7]AXQ30620.1 hypothetical protein D0B54_18885 [Solimonas sp. K1W22B-7]
MDRLVGAAPSAPGTVGIIASWRVFAYLSSTLAAVAWTLYAGKDLNWDSLNYHLYAGFSALNDRFSTDYFAASLQGYLNPYAHAPFYLMVQAQWPSWAIGTAFACFHALNLWLCYELALTLIPGPARTKTQCTALLGMALAALNPVFLQELGSSFNDISTSVLVVGGWVALAKGLHRPSWQRWALGGLLLGAAAALKLSNAIFCLASAPMLLFLTSGAERLRYAGVLCVAGCLGFFGASGPWAYRLWQEFGNPYFPMLNEYFKSPHLTSAPFKHLRFVPESVVDAFLRPFQMAWPIADVHTEPRAPDIRYATLMLLIPAWLFLNRFRVSPAGAPQIPDTAASFRVLPAVVLSVCIAWILWLWTSGNSRYFLPMSCIAGVLIAVLLVNVLRGPRAMAYAIAGLLGMQALNAYMSPSRWTPAPWDDQWFDLQIPERFQTAPYLYLSVSSPSLSFLLPYLAPGSGLINISGTHILDPDGANGTKVRELMARNRGRVRMIAEVHLVTRDGAPAPAITDYDHRLQKFGLRVDPADCAYFRVIGDFYSVVVGSSESSPHPPPAKSTGDTYAFTCGLHPLPTVDRVASHEAQEHADVVFNRIEDSCPDFFSPRRPVTERKNMGWRRIYVNTDTQLWTYNDLVLALRYPIDSQPVYLGKMHDWGQKTQSIDCPKRRAPFSERASFSEKTPQPLRRAANVTPE